jgi:hypothetical protein
MSRGKHHEPEPEQEQSHDQWLADQFGDQLNNLDWANMTEEERAAAEAMIELLGKNTPRIGKSAFPSGQSPIRRGELMMIPANTKVSRKSRERALEDGRLQLCEVFRLPAPHS